MPLNILQRQPGTQPLGTTSIYRQGSTRGDHLCLAGPAGTGKSHLSEALGRAACEAGHRVRFFSADELLEALYHGLADNTVGRLIGGLLRNDLVVIDDLGFTTTDRVAAEHLFRVVSAAYEAAQPDRPAGAGRCR